MVPWRGGLLFKQYIPDKSHKYGVKIYKVTNTNSYTWGFMVFVGKQDSITGLGRGQTVVIDLIDDLLGCYLTVIADN